RLPPELGEPTSTLERVHPVEVEAEHVREVDDLVGCLIRALPRVHVQQPRRLVGQDVGHHPLRRVPAVRADLEEPQVRLASHRQQEPVEVPLRIAAGEPVRPRPLQRCLHLWCPISCRTNLHAIVDRARSAATAETTIAVLAILCAAVSTTGSAVVTTTVSGTGSPSSSTCAPVT